MADKKLLDLVRDILRIEHYRYKTEKSYVHWIRRFILFHHKRHPLEMAEPEIVRFLNHLASEAHVASFTQNQALNAIVFLYKKVLNRELGEFQGLNRRKGPQNYAAGKHE
jgi:hypothetical protein